MLSYNSVKVTAFKQKPDEWKQFERLFLLLEHTITQIKALHTNEQLRLTRALPLTANKHYIHTQLFTVGWYLGPTQIGEKSKVKWTLNQSEASPFTLVTHTNSKLNIHKLALSLPRQRSQKQGNDITICCHMFYSKINEHARDWSLCIPFPFVWPVKSSTFLYGISTNAMVAWTKTFTATVCTSWHERRQPQ